MMREISLLGCLTSVAPLQESHVNRPKRNTQVRNRVFFITIVTAIAIGLWVARG